MGKADRIYLKFEDLDWDDDEAIDAFAASLHSALVDRLDPKENSAHKGETKKKENRQ